MSLADAYRLALVRL